VVGIDQGAGGDQEEAYRFGLRHVGRTFVKSKPRPCLSVVETTSRLCI
jgi:hypothetical protein